jgi:aminoglycoside 3-N-acetyltransferase
MLAELFRSSAGVARTAHPIFSVSAKGALVPRILAASVEDSFGPRTVFDLLHETNALIACLACGFDRITFVHYIEQCARVDYRFFKPFDAEVIEDGRARRFPVRYLVRDLARETQTDLARLKARLQSNGLLRMVPFGRAALMAVRARDFHETAMALLAERPDALIREGA